MKVRKEIETDTHAHTHRERERDEREREFICMKVGRVIANKKWIESIDDTKSCDLFEPE